MAGRRIDPADFERARAMYEEGRSFLEIEEELGISRITLSAHASREGWIKRSAILQSSQIERVRSFVDEFIEQDREAIKRNLAIKHSLNERILKLAERHIERLEENRLFAVQTGTGRDGTPIVVDEDPVVSLRRLSLVCQSVEAMDKSIADLKDGTWRAKEDKPAEVSTESMTPKQIEQLLSAMDKPQDEAEVN